MPDKDKIRKGLECIANDRQKSCVGCEYSTFGLYPFCVRNIARDAILLLEEQEEHKEAKHVMKTKVFLDKYDVQRIVAKHYNVDPKQVDMHLYITTDGYGMDTHDVPAIEVIVTTGEETKEII